MKPQSAGRCRTGPAASAVSARLSDNPIPRVDDPRTAELQAVFRRSLPAPDWSRQVHRCIVVALVDLRDWRRWLPEAALLIDPVETARVVRRRFSADREALVLSYALHRLLLASTMDVHAADVPIDRDERGCPRLGGCPRPQRLAEGALSRSGRAGSPPSNSAICTSLSHSGDFAAFAVTATGPVGIDIEPAASAAVMAGIAERICSTGEAEAIHELPEPPRSEALLALWVRKEALLKAAGVGLACEMTDFHAPAGRVLPLPAGEGVAEIRMLNAGDGCVAAVAGAPGVAVDSVWLRPRV